MFDQTFVNTHAQTRRPWTVAASLILQTGLVAIAFLAPLLHVATLQRPETVPVWLPLETLKHPPEIRQAKPLTRAPAAARPVFRLASLQAPLIVPWRIDMAPDAPLIVNALTTASGVPSVLALPGAIIDASPLPPAAVSPKPPSAPGPIRISGGVESAKLTFGPKPAYPPLARATRVQGVVRLQATIGRDGLVRDLRVLSGPPLLINLALEAVQQWRYQPTLLNGQPVEVLTEVDVNFTIGQ